MSSIVSHEFKTMLRKLLADEKDATRVWLRAEMDRLTDPLLDTLFCRLETKLTNGLERTQSGGDGDCEQVGNPNESNNPMLNIHLHQPSSSTSSHLITQHQNVHHYYQQPTNEPIHSNQLSELNPNFVQPINSLIGQVNFGEITNEPTTDQVHFPQSLSIPTIGNESKFNQNSNDRKLNDEEEDEDDEECDCDDCVYGGIEVKEENEDDDSVRLIDDDQEEEETSSRPVKKLKLDSIQSPNGQLSLSQQTEESQQPKQVNKQVITVHLQCPLSNCFDTFPEEQLNQHLWDEHSIDSSRCVVKDCGQSFQNSHILGEHINQFHKGTSQWQCDKCSKNYSTYHLLSCHNNLLHQLGHFQCSFPSCTFTGEYRKKMFNHYTQHHKQTLSCQHCNYRTSNAKHLKQHERIHSGIKPYRCTWPECDFASTRKDNAIKHIRCHLAAANPGSVPNGAQLDPSDYLEVVDDLL